MNESLLRDENLTTADIANPVRTSMVPPADVNEQNIQPVQENRQPQRAQGQTSAQTRGQSPGQAQGQTSDTRETAAQQRTAEPNPLFPDDELHNFRARWDQVQTSFVDEPRQAVEQADSLVANVVKRIAEQFSAERATLEQQWAQGDNVSTEDLRQALRRYRSFFDRLLTF
jgi:hypothetical protein